MSKPAVTKKTATSASKKLLTERPDRDCLTTYFVERDETWKSFNPDGLIEFLSPIEGVHLDQKSTEILTKSLPFYKGPQLLKVCKNKLVSEREFSFFIKYDDIIIPLKGRSENIFETNNVSAPLINKETVLDYLKFFCLFIEGPYFIIENADSEFITGYSPLDKARILNGYEGAKITDGIDRFVVNIRVLHENILYEVIYEVFKDGNVTMTEDKHIYYI